MKKINKFSKCIISLLLCVVTALNIVLIKPYSAEVDKGNISDSAVAVSNTTVPETSFKVNMLDMGLIEEDKKHEYVSANSGVLVGNSSPEISEDEMIEFQILKFIYISVAYDISEQGFDVFESNIIDLDKDLVTFGLTYTTNEKIADNYIYGGCVKITKDNTVLDENRNYISLNNGENDGNRYIITKNNILNNNDHFVYFDKYVKYYWVNSMTIKYEIKNNIKSNYDKSFGAIFSYDDMKYIFDNDFTYTSIEVQTMFTQIDFDNLQNTIDEINEEQKKNGYYVSEITITYIDYNLIEQWERSKDKTTIFGFDLEELNATFGADSTLEFTADGNVKKAELIKTKTTNWLKVGLMIGAGVAAMLIGAALAPLTGGCSFGASLLVIAKMTAVAVITDLVVQTAISTVVGVIQGQSFADALSSAAKNTLDPENVAKAFMMSAIMSAVMVGSGLVKACFVEGTSVAGKNGNVAIENVKVGDKVLSFDESTGLSSFVAVTEIMKNKTNDICSVALDSGETITSTSLHPWFTQNRGWVPAYDLQTSDILLTQTGENVKILGVHRQKLNQEIDVYNLTVGDSEDESYHTYFVGDDGILVHNACSSKANNNGTNQTNQPSAKEIKNARQDAVRKAWKKEQEAVINGTSKYGWNPKQADELLKYGKIKGYDGCHLIDVSKCGGDLNLIGNPDNIVFLQRAQHLFIHDGSWLNPTNLQKVKDLLPWVVKQLSKLGL